MWATWRRVRRKTACTSGHTPSKVRCSVAIQQVVAGAYTSTYKGVGITGPSLGFNDENGFEIEQQTHGELVDNSDLYGGSLLDWVHRGGSVFCTFNCLTYQFAVNRIKAVFYPWGLLGVMASAGTPIGVLASQVAGILALTAVSSTPVAAAGGPNTFTATKAILPPNSNGRLMMSTRVKKAPIRLALLPSESALTATWWTET